jgi:D-amino peptidase
MNVFISTDMEGVSGVVGWQDVKPEGGVYYEAAKRRLTMDINAAVEGALEGGAGRILVADVHGYYTNVLYEELHPEAELVRGTPQGHRHLLIMEGLDASFALVLMIGYHAQSRDWPGVLSHTYSNAFFLSVRFNGVNASEARIGAAMAGSFGVPVGMVSGDNRICAEVEEWLSGVETAVVKYAIDRYAARCVSHKKALGLIETAARRAVQRVDEFKPFTFEPPVRLEVSFVDPSLAYRMTTIPGVNRIANDTVAYEAKDFLEAHNAFRAICYVSVQGAS